MPVRARLATSDHQLPYVPTVELVVRPKSEFEPSLFFTVLGDEQVVGKGGDEEAGGAKPPMWTQTVDGLTKGVAYKWRVKARATLAGWSSWSAWGELPMPSIEAPEWDEDLSVVKSSTSAELIWRAAETFACIVERYEVMMCAPVPIDGGKRKWVEAGTVAVDEGSRGQVSFKLLKERILSASLGKLRNNVWQRRLVGRKCEFIVRAWASVAKESDWSEPLEMTLPIVHPPSKPTAHALGVTTLRAGWSVPWTVACEVESYELQLLDEAAVGVLEAGGEPTAMLTRPDLADLQLSLTEADGIAGTRVDEAGTLIVCKYAIRMRAVAKVAGPSRWSEASELVTMPFLGWPYEPPPPADTEISTSLPSARVVTAVQADVSTALVKWPALRHEVACSAATFEVEVFNVSQNTPFTGVEAGPATEAAAPATAAWARIRERRRNLEFITPNRQLKVRGLQPGKSYKFRVRADFLREGVVESSEVRDGAPTWESCSGVSDWSTWSEVLPLPQMRMPKPPESRAIAADRVGLVWLSADAQLTTEAEAGAQSAAAAPSQEIISFRLVHKAAGNKKFGKIELADALASDAGMHDFEEGRYNSHTHGALTPGAHHVYRLQAEFALGIRSYFSESSQAVVVPVIARPDTPKGEPTATADAITVSWRALESRGCKVTEVTLHITQIESEANQTACELPSGRSYVTLPAASASPAALQAASTASDETPLSEPGAAAATAHDSNDGALLQSHDILQLTPASQYRVRMQGTAVLPAFHFWPEWRLASAWSDSVSVVVPPTPPRITAAKATMPAGRTSTRLEVAWEAVGGFAREITAFECSAAVDVHPRVWISTPLLAADKLNAHFDDFAPKDQVVLRVRVACEIAGERLVWSAWSEERPPTAMPHVDPPESIDVGAISSTSLAAAWLPAPRDGCSITGYTLAHAADGVVWVEKALLGDHMKTSAVVAELDAGVEYHCRIRTHSDLTEPSAWSASVKVKLPLLKGPERPVAQKLPGRKGLIVTWNALEEQIATACRVASFEVQLSTDGRTWQDQLYPSTERSITIPALPTCRTYHARARAVAEVPLEKAPPEGYSWVGLGEAKAVEARWSEGGQAVLPGLEWPEVGESATAKSAERVATAKSRSSLSVAWRPVIALACKVLSYTVQLWEWDDVLEGYRQLPAVQEPNAECSRQFAEVKPGGTYACRIRARAEDDESDDIFSTWLPCKPVTLPLVDTPRAPAVAADAPGAEQASITVTWSKPRELACAVTRYDVQVGVTSKEAIFCKADVGKAVRELRSNSPRCHGAAISLPCNLVSDRRA